MSSILVIAQVEFPKNTLGVFERGENLLYNSLPRFALRLSQSSGIVLEIYTDEKVTFL